MKSKMASGYEKQDDVRKPRGVWHILLKRIETRWRPGWKPPRPLLPPWGWEIMPPCGWVRRRAWTHPAASGAERCLSSQLRRSRPRRHVTCYVTNHVIGNLISKFLHSIIGLLGVRAIWNWMKERSMNGILSGPTHSPLPSCEWTETQNWARAPSKQDGIGPGSRRRVVQWAPKVGKWPRAQTQKQDGVQDCV